MKKASITLLICILLSFVSYLPLRAQDGVVPLPPTPRNATICGEFIVALTPGNTLLTFNSDLPGTILSSVPISGLAPGESIIGIDFRPFNRILFGLSDQSRLFTIDPITGVARLASTLTVGIASTALGVDFNPVPDRLRVVNATGQNLRINVETGGVTVDGSLGFVAGDANASATPNVVAAAYSNNFAGTLTTTLYVIDTGRDILAIQNPPNDGRLNTVGSLGLDATGFVGFDLSGGSARAFASLTPAGGTTGLYTINLATGAATLVGAIGNGGAIRDIAIMPRPPLTLWGLTQSGFLVAFDQNINIVDFKRVKGLPRGERLLAIDFRPANGRLYALGASGTIYTININNGRAIPRPTAPFSAALNGTSFGFDFNPVPDRIRLTSNATQNLRLNPDTGDLAATDGNARFATGDRNASATPNIVGSAYANNFAGTATTTLYTIDSNLDILAIQNPPNDGIQNTVGSLGVDTTDVVGFDIYACDNVGYAALLLPGETESKLYRINLLTGAATVIGTIPVGEPTVGLAIQFQR